MGRCGIRMPIPWDKVILGAGAGVSPLQRGAEVKVRAHHLTLIAAVVVCAALLATALYIHVSVQAASELTTRGMAQALTFSVQEALREAGGQPAELAKIVESLEEDGLRYVAVARRGGDLVSAGEPLGSALRPGLERVGERARVVRPIRGRRALRLFGPRPFAFDREEGPRARRGALLVLEFEPLPALALESQSRRLLVVSIGASLGILALALAFARAQRQREALLLEVEQGRRLAALGTMSAVLAHELKNPLASLKGHAQLLAESVEQDPALAPKADLVVGEAVRLQTLMEELLAFVKSGELNRAPVDVESLTRAAVEAAGAREATVKLFQTSSRFLLDGARLAQALENLIRNAQQAASDAASAEVEVECARAGRALVWTIRDRGPGIPPEDVERIFEPFMTTRTRGVGLGLALTRRIAELHGGSVVARNREGGGAEFVLTLPAEEA